MPNLCFAGNTCWNCTGCRTIRSIRWFAWKQGLPPTDQGGGRQDAVGLSKQLIGEVRIPLPVAEGQPARYDSEYKRLGVRNQFMFVEPLAGWRKVFVRQRRTMIDWAFCIREILDVHDPDAQKVRLVLSQPQHAHGGLVVRSISPSRSSAIVRASGVPSHARTRQLAAPLKKTRRPRSRLGS